MKIDKVLFIRFSLYYLANLRKFKSEIKTLINKNQFSKILKKINNFRKNK